MSLLKTLKEKGSQLSRDNGKTPTNIAETKDSKLHYNYSITGIPNIPGMPSPSVLDTDAKTPVKYSDSFVDGK